jgi:prephenate dehydrogenase
MMLDILLTNREEVLKAVGAYQAQLASLARSLEAGDEGELRETLGTIREKRREMFP